MNIILLGAPGAGKGTQATRLKEKYNLPHISTGDIFRSNIKGGTALGKLASTYINRGQLVPDSVVCDLVADRLSQADCESGFLLDGFPRTIAQAQSLALTQPILTVVNIVTDLEALMPRLTGRRVCSKCGESFHINSYTKSVCNRCGGELYTRDDDKEATVLQRLTVYTQQTSPLIEFYSAKGQLLNIDGMQSPDEVFESIVCALEQA